MPDRRAYKHRYYIEKRDGITGGRRRVYQKRPVGETRAEYFRQYQAAHRDEDREYRRAYRKRPEVIDARRTLEAERQKERRPAYMREYLRRPEAQALNRARRDRWIKANPDLARRTALASVSRRRARLAGGGGSHTAQEWRDKCALLGSVCLYCGEAKPLTRDHKVPIARGGTDDIFNVVPACGSCNRRKGTKTAREFLGLAA